MKRTKITLKQLDLLYKKLNTAEKDLEKAIKDKQALEQTKLEDKN